MIQEINTAEISRQIDQDTDLKRGNFYASMLRVCDWFIGAVKGINVQENDRIFSASSSEYPDGSTFETIHSEYEVLTAEQDRVLVGGINGDNDMGSGGVDMLNASTLQTEEKEAAVMEPIIKVPDQLVEVPKIEGIAVPNDQLEVAQDGRSVEGVLTNTGRVMPLITEIVNDGCVDIGDGYILGPEHFGSDPNMRNAKFTKNGNTWEIMVGGYQIVAATGDIRGFLSAHGSLTGLASRIGIKVKACPLKTTDVPQQLPDYSEMRELVI